MQKQLEKTGSRKSTTTGGASDDEVPEQIQQYIVRHNVSKLSTKLCSLVRRHCQPVCEPRIAKTLI